jgi:hypothetical protein
MVGAAEKLLLIGLGGRRCGSTWLGDYLDAHPDVFMSPVKELQHFSARLRPEILPRADAAAIRSVCRVSEQTGDGDPTRSTPYQRAVLDTLKSRVRMIWQEDEYPNFFLDRVGDRHVMCEITPEYSLFDRAQFERMAAVLPTVRFALVMRNPIDRYWSDLHLQATRGVSLQDEAGIVETLVDPLQWSRGDYPRTLNELLAAVDGKNVFLEFFERLFDDSAMAKLCGFLGIAFQPGSYGARVHDVPHPVAPERLRAKLYAKLSRVYEDIHEHFAGDVPDSWRNDMVAYG